MKISLSVVGLNSSKATSAVCHHVGAHVQAALSRRARAEFFQHKAQGYHAPTQHPKFLKRQLNNPLPTKPYYKTRGREKSKC
ncbi:hypothetical protein, partial [Hymenobacter sp.]|uniref:hypothetical protein n=1 Tax=Hymenobacter sp. TaxID=1898978 RepID=UPI002ED7D640